MSFRGNNRPEVYARGATVSCKKTTCESRPGHPLPNNLLLYFWKVHEYSFHVWTQFSSCGFKVDFHKSSHIV